MRAGGCTPQRVDHQQQLHQIVIGGLAGALQTKTSLPRTFSFSSTVISPSENLLTLASPRLSIQPISHTCRKLGVCVARKDHHL